MNARNMKESYRVSDKRLTVTALVLFLLATYVKESEQQVMSLRQARWKGYFYFLIKVWGPEKKNNTEQ